MLPSGVVELRLLAEENGRWLDGADMNGNGLTEFGSGRFVLGISVSVES